LVAAITPYPSLAGVTLVVAPLEGGHVATVLRSADRTVEAVPTWTGALDRLRGRPKIAVMLVVEQLLLCTPVQARCLVAEAAPDTHFVLLTHHDAEAAEHEVDPSIPFIAAGAAPIDLLLTVAFLHALGSWPPHIDVPDAWAPLLPSAAETHRRKSDR
jgi:hypothetical protein